MVAEVRIAVDAMGGDSAPGVNIDGALAALKADTALKVDLIGPKAVLLDELKARHATPDERLALIHTDEVISMHDHAAVVARRKKGSSIHVGMRAVKEGQADAFLSAGHSGAMMTVALLELGRLPGVERPAIAVKLPTVEGTVTLIDSGANVDCRASHLVQFAHMGQSYASTLDKIASPRIALLSNGSEAHKGNDLVREVHGLLGAQSGMNYLGYIEGFDLFRGSADVVVCDGFVGNIVLKVAEGLADTSFRWFKHSIRRDLRGLLGVWLLKNTLVDFRKKFDYQPYGAAPLLGIDGMVLISHGSSSSVAICNGILTAKRGVEAAFVQKMASTLRGEA